MNSNADKECSFQREGHLDVHAYRHCLAIRGSRFEPPLLEGRDRRLIETKYGIKRAGHGDVASRGPSVRLFDQSHQFITLPGGQPPVFG
jgi:hypothetical protein